MVQQYADGRGEGQCSPHSSSCTWPPNAGLLVDRRLIGSFLTSTTN